MTPTTQVPTAQPRGIVVDNKGRTYDSPFTDYDAKVYCKLHLADDKLIKSFIEQVKSGKKLSDRQLEWVHIKACEHKEQADSRIDASLLVAHFQTALTNGVDDPIIVLKTDLGKVVLRRFPPTYRSAGNIRIGDGRNVDHSRYYGQVDWNTGFYYLPRNFDNKPIIDLIAKLAANPIEIIGDNAAENDICCYCSRTLSDERSIAARCGQICAGKWGIPWG
jgi:hypothetical protein